MTSFEFCKRPKLHRNPTFQLFLESRLRPFFTASSGDHFIPCPTHLGPQVVQQVVEHGPCEQGIPWWKKTWSQQIEQAMASTGSAKSRLGSPSRHTASLKDHSCHSRKIQTLGGYEHIYETISPQIGDKSTNPAIHHLTKAHWASEKLTGDK